MSVVFEGVIFIAGVEKLRESCADFVREHSTPEYAFEQIDADLSVVYGVGPERRFYDEFVGLAEQLSVPMGKSLLIRYDNREDTNSSYCYENGELIAGFDHEDEIFVEIDENGKIPDSRRYTWDEVLELPDEIEVETITDAFDYGLEALGKGDRETVFNFVTS